MDQFNTTEYNYLNDIESLPDVGWDGVDTCGSGTPPAPREAYVLVPTCSCDYIKWIVHRENFIFPYLGNELCPTRHIKDQCQYCGYYVCWVRVGVKVFESQSFPQWANEKYFGEVLEKTWFTHYAEALERIQTTRTSSLNTTWRRVPNSVRRKNGV